jgi:hypothetical protein
MPAALLRKIQQTPAIAVRRTNRGAIYPAPSKGLAVDAPLLMMDPQTASVLKNMWCRRQGNELRAGYERWVSNIPAAVNSMMAYNPPRGTGGLLQPKLFAAAADGNIYDVTASHDEAYVPTAAQAIPGQIDAGVFSHTQFATPATNYLCICAAGAGYWTYDASGGWVNRTASITGAGTAPPKFDFVMAWKNRLWFVENDSTRAWYLATNAIQGSANEFDFGGLFVHGGDLKALASWTVDAGEGVDDKLVVAGQGGDILVYQGTDPASATTFAIVGRWYVGHVPAGRRFMDKYGGDLMIICENGIERMTRLLQGRGLLSPREESLAMDRYTEVIAADVRLTRFQKFWQMIALIGEETLLVLTPHTAATNSKQYAFGTLSQGWSENTNMPMVCADVFEGDLYFGTPTGTVCKAFSGETDDQLSDATPGRTVVGEVQTAFVAMDNDNQNHKRVLMVMPMFQAPRAPSLALRVNTEWSYRPPGATPILNSVDTALWNVALWNAALWGGAPSTYNTWVGAEGLGVYASLRLAVAGAPGTTFTSWKLLTEAGGVM